MGMKTSELLQKHHFSIIDNAMCGIALVDSDFRFVYLNKRFCEMMEYSPAEIVGRTFQSVTIPNDAEAESAMARRVMDGEIEEYTMVKQYISKTGKMVPVVLHVRGYMAGERMLEVYIAQVRDITDPRIEQMITDLQATVKSQEATISRLVQVMEVNSKRLADAAAFLGKHWLKILVAIAVLLAAMAGQDVIGLVRALRP